MISKTYRLLASIAVGIFLGAMAVFNTVDRDNHLYRENPLSSLIGSIIPSIGAAIVTYYWILGRGGKGPEKAPAIARHISPILADMPPTHGNEGPLPDSSKQEPEKERLYDLPGFKRLAIAISGGVFFVTYAALFFDTKNASIAELSLGFPLCSLLFGLGAFLLIRVSYWATDGFRLHKKTTT